MYSVDGSPIGLAVRSVAIVRSAELLDHAPAPADPRPGVDLSLPAGQVAPDLTVRIERAESQSSGRLLVQLLAADPAIDTPDAPILIDIGGDPASDLRRIADEMLEVEGKPTQYVALRGIGLTIADQLPIEFWNVLADGRGARRRPSPDHPVPVGRAVRPVGARRRRPAARSRPAAVPRGPGDRRSLAARSAPPAAAAADVASRSVGSRPCRASTSYPAGSD